MKCAFLLWMLSVTRGGTERMGSELANALAEQGHELVIFMRGSEPAPPVYPLHPAIRREYIREKALHQQTGIAEGRRILLAHAPDVVVGFESSALLMFAAALVHGTGIPLVLSEHSDALIIEKERWNRPDRLTVFSAAAAIVLLTEQARHNLPDALLQKTHVIPNYTPLPAYDGPTDRHLTGPLTICAVGRLLDEIKQQSLLIRAFSLLHKNFPHWRLCFYGKDAYGEQAGLEALVQELALHDSVFFMGEVDDVRAAYSAAHIFCIPSRYEGFPLVVVEAMRHSLPVVGFTDCRILKELVTPDCGILAGNMSPESLAAALAALMADATRRKSLGAAALQKSYTYTPEAILPVWKTLLSGLAAGHSKACLLAAKENRQIQPTPYGAWSCILRVYSLLLERSGLFDREWYRKKYIRGPEYMDPLEHYVRFGADKGFRPNVDFDTEMYRRTCMAGEPLQMNPLLHAVLWGNRMACSVPASNAPSEMHPLQQRGRTP